MDVTLRAADTSAAEGGCHQQTYFNVLLWSHTVSQRPQCEKANVSVSPLLGIKNVCFQYFTQVRARSLNSEKQLLKPQQKLLDDDADT